MAAAFSGLSGARVAASEARTMMAFSNRHSQVFDLKLLEARTIRVLAMTVMMAAAKSS